MNIAAGTKLGRYEIRSKIGEGGMGEVYLAQDTKLDRKVAVKILPAELAANQDRMRRFVQEAKAASALNHPNIITIYEVDETESGHFIATEFIDGKTLREHERRSPLTLNESLDVAIQIAGALMAAHEAGIVHRDIKPENVMLRRDGIIKVLDFGLAKLMGQSPGATDSEAATRAMVNTGPGVVMGTMNYMSPEQARGVDLDARTDIWSLGVVLYEMVTGHVPFEGTTSSDVIARILEREPAPLARFTRDAPEALEWIVSKALSRDRGERYQTAREMLADLKKLRRRLDLNSEMERSVAPEVSTGQPGSISSRFGLTGATRESVMLTDASPPTRATSSAEYLVSEIKRHKIGAALIATLLVVLTAGLIIGIYKFSTGNKTVASLESRKFTRLTNSGRVGAATISPDGKYVVYPAQNEAGQPALWIKYLATGSTVQIVAATPDLFFGQLTFSPDGNYIYYLRVQRAQPSGVLYQVPVLGGTSKKILDNVSRISFSPDGKRLTFERRYATEGEDAIIVVNADGSGGEQKLATRKHPDYFLPGGAWSPDGQTIACPIGGFENGAYRSVAIVQVSDGTQKHLTSQRWSDVQRVEWLSDGSGIVTTANEQQGGPYQIWQISYPDGQAQRLTNDLSDYRNISLTADSKTLVALLYDKTSNIWVAPNQAWKDARQLTSSKTNGGFGTTWTPDGRMVYDSRANGNPDIWIADADGHNQKQLTDDAYTERSPSVSPDGRHVVFDSAHTGTLQVWKMDIDGSNLKQLTSGAGFTPVFSPDGKWVLYTTFGTGGFSIWKVPSDGGEPVQVIGKYALVPTVSPDGKLIACYYVDEKNGVSRIALFPFEGGEPTKLFDLPQPPNPGTPPLRWLPDSSAITYVATRGGVTNIWLQPIDGGEAKQLTDFKSNLIFSFDWSRDGKQLACSRGTEDRDVILINNFR